MSRNPSIHIRRTDLKIVLLNSGIQVSDSQMDLIFQNAIHYKLSDRHLIFSNKKQNLERLEKNHKVETAPVEIFNGCLTLVRQDIGHRFFEKIDRTSVQYSVLKEVSMIAEEYCKTFNLGLREGFVEFCRLGLDLMGKKYGLNKFKFYKEKIFKQKEWEILIQDDAGSTLTAEVISYYKSTLLSKGTTYEIDRVEEYVDFIYCKQEIQESNSKVKDWIDAQFIKLEFLDIYPNPNQLYGDGARKRYKEYMLTIPGNSNQVDSIYDPSKFLSKFKK